MEKAKIPIEKIKSKVIDNERNLGQYARHEIPIDDFIHEAYIEGYADGHHDGYIARLDDNEEEAKN